MKEQATTRPDILHFFGQEKFIFLGKSLGILKSYACGSHVYMHSIFMYQWNNYFQLNISTQYPTLHHTVLRQVTWFFD